MLLDTPPPATRAGQGLPPPLIPPAGPQLALPMAALTSLTALAPLKAPPSGPGAGLNLALSSRAMMRMLDVIDYGMLLVTDEGQVAYGNGVARADLAGMHPLLIEDGLLSARRPEDLLLLRGALQAASRRAMQSLLTVGEPGGERVGLSVVPLAEPGELPTTLLVLGKRQACEELSRDAYARHHGLTMAETRVLASLCRGIKPAEIARNFGVKLATVRTQIGSIRTKTGARDIRDIQHQLSRLPPLPTLMRRGS